MIEIKNIKKSYKETNALKGISLSVKKGETLLILGPNGAGKTTLMKVLLGLIYPDAGEISIDGDVKIGYMQEERFGKPGWTVLRLLRYAGELAGLEGDVLEERIDVMLRKFQVEKKKNSRIKELSKGLRQRVKCAQAALIDPDIFILDEPTSGLDPIGKIEMRNWIKEENEKGKTIIISSHLLDEMEKTGTRFTILVEGEIRDEGDIGKLPARDLEQYFYNIVKGEQNEDRI
jgi:ABC-2 type transport system ATP-binding protein